MGAANLLHEQANPPPRAEVFQQRCLPLLTDAGEFVEDALGDYLEPELGIVGVGEPVRFVPHALEKVLGRSLDLRCFLLARGAAFC